MHKLLLVIAAAMTLTFTLGYADQTKNKIVIPVDRTDRTNGKQMYTSYCAPCHGSDGRGHGPAASALKNPPVNLTTLAKTNNGKFPETHVLSVLQFGTELPAHGSAEMPVWGPILGKINQTVAQDRDLRISNLTRYLQSIQEK